MRMKIGLIIGVRYTCHVKNHEQDAIGFGIAAVPNLY